MISKESISEKEETLRVYITAYLQRVNIKLMILKDKTDKRVKYLVIM